MRFWKAHGCGNDFMIVNLDDFKHIVDWPYFAKTMSDRRFCVGFDQLLIFKDNTVQFYNADGSLAQNCGNGLRCLAKLLMVQKKRQDIVIKTPFGHVECRKKQDLISIDMPQPKWKIVDIKARENLFLYPCLHINIGNPHLVCFVENIDEIEDFGPILERHYLFLDGVNVSFVKINDLSNIELRVWERGAGPTLACGSGASASVVAGNVLDILGPCVSVNQKGGGVQISYNQNKLELTGPAVIVYEGKLSYDLRNFNAL